MSRGYTRIFTAAIRKLQLHVLDICCCIWQITWVHKCTVKQTAVGHFGPMRTGSPFKWGWICPVNSLAQNRWDQGVRWQKSIFQSHMDSCDTAAVCKCGEATAPAAVSLVPSSITKISSFLFINLSRKMPTNRFSSHLQTHTTHYLIKTLTCLQKLGACLLLERVAKGGVLGRSTGGGAINPGVWLGLH